MSLPTYLIVGQVAELRYFRVTLQTVAYTLTGEDLATPYNRMVMAAGNYVRTHYLPPLYAYTGPNDGAVVLEEMFVSLGTNASSGEQTAACLMEPLKATGSGYGWNSGDGAVVMEKLSVESLTPGGAVVFEKMKVQGTSATIGVGACVMQPLRAQTDSGGVVMPYMTAYGTGESVVPETYFTPVMNTRTYNITTYSNHRFNSYAKIGGDYYGAGPDGLIRLGAGFDDDGNDIPWDIKTGQMDDKDPGLKRLPEVMLSMRNTGDVLVTVWQDDNESNDYVLPATKTDDLHQQRVKCGKGMRSRYYAVELRPVDGSRIELDSAQINMTKTTRRVG